MSEDKKYWEGFDYALSLLEEMYGRSNFQHPYNIVDCVKAKVNRLPQEQIRTSIPAASPVSDAVERETFLKQLRRLSVERAKNGFKTYDNQPITYWTTAIIGEFGELCNMIKKMKRAENGGHDSGHSYTAKDITPKMLREEIGGTFIYIDLLCSFLNIDIQEAIVETFNEKSVELGFPYLLNLPTPTSVQEQDVSFSYEDMMDIAGWMAAADPKRPIPELKEEAEVYIKTKLAARNPS